MSKQQRVEARDRIARFVEYWEESWDDARYFWEGIKDALYNLQHEVPLTPHQETRLRNLHNHLMYYRSITHTTKNLPLTNSVWLLACEDAIQILSK